jgi:membrane protein
MSDPGQETDRRTTGPDESADQDDGGLRDHIGSATVRTKSATVRTKDVSLAVPFRAARRNSRVAASVLAGGVAYRLFLWLVPFGLVVGGLLGLGNADDIEEALAGGGLPGAVVNAIGDGARAAESNSWWLLLVGVWLLLWAGYTGAKALQLIHALVWSEPPPKVRPVKNSLAFTATCLVFIAVGSLTWWIRDAAELTQLLTAAVMVLPLAALWLGVSFLLPHGQANWKSLLPGALFTAIAFQVLHGLVVHFLADKLEKSTSLYGALGIVTTLLFFMYLVGRIIVTAPILNSSLHEELRGERPAADGPPETPSAPSGNGRDSSVQVLAP